MSKGLFGRIKQLVNEIENAFPLWNSPLFCCSCVLKLQQHAANQTASIRVDVHKGRARILMRYEHVRLSDNYQI